MDSKLDLVTLWQNVVYWWDIYSFNPHKIATEKVMEYYQAYRKQGGKRTIRVLENKLKTAK